MRELNPSDETVWDPLNPEFGIVDPLHGPSAVSDMFEIPPMPRGNGIYLQPGAFYVYGTPYVDSCNIPVFLSGGSTMSLMREALDLQEWVEAYREGDEALTELEAKRQRERLEKTGLAHTFKPSDVCPGGKRLKDCETGNTAYEAGDDWTSRHNNEEPGEGTLSNVIAWAGGTCVGCSVSCEVAVKTIDGQAQETRVSFYKPDPNIRVINLDINSLKPVNDPKALEDLERILGELGKGKTED